MRNKGTDLGYELYSGPLTEDSSPWPWPMSPWRTVLDKLPQTTEPLLEVQIFSGEVPTQWWSDKVCSDAPEKATETVLLYSHQLSFMEVQLRARGKLLGPWYLPEGKEEE